eukprot:SAG22_NODE_11760_length_470_cov_1.191375_2_plen_48_part_01
MTSSSPSNSGSTSSDETTIALLVTKLRHCLSAVLPLVFYLRQCLSVRS